MTTVRVPGSARSMPNCCLPVDLSRASSRPVGLPISLNCCGDFSCTLVGTGSARAAAASSPYEARRPSGAVTTPASAFSCPAGTPKRLAAPRAALR